MSGESDIEPHGVDIPVSELPISATARVRRTIDELPYVVHDGSAATELVIHLGTVQIVAVAYLRSDQLTTLTERASVFVTITPRKTNMETRGFTLTTLRLASSSETVPLVNPEFINALVADLRS